MNKLILKEAEVSEDLDFREKEYRESLKREINLLKLKLKILENLEEASV